MFLRSAISFSFSLSFFSKILLESFKTLHGSHHAKVREREREREKEREKANRYTGASVAPTDGALPASSR